MTESSVRAERRGVPFRTLAWVMIGLTCLLAVGAAVAYFRLLHYRRTAALHLPEKVEMAARLEVEQVVLFEPVRRHLLPLLDRLPGSGRTAAAAAPEEDFLTRLRREASLNLGLDLRELVVGSTAHGEEWVAVLGGLFPRSGLVAAIEPVLRATGAGAWSRVDDVLVSSASGIALGQAADGVLLVASDRTTLASSLPSTPRHAALGLPLEGAGSAQLSELALRSWPPVFLLEQLGVRDVGGELRLKGETIEVELRVRLRDDASAERLAALVARGRQAGSDLPVDLAAEGWVPWSLLARVERVDVSESVVRFTTSLRPSELDRAARDLAAWVTRQL